MKVVIFHPALLPPKDYGGTERVVLWLTKGLVERGHEVWVGAASGSVLPKGARLIEFSKEKSSAVDLLERLPNGTDLVHFMAPPEAGVLEKLPRAHLLTVHGQGKPGEIFPKNTVFLSKNHATRNQAVAFVHHGLDPDEYAYDPSRKQKNYLFLSKTTWSVKNLRGALHYCAEAGVSLTVAGGSRPWTLRAGAKFKNLFSRSKVTWAGSVNGEKKASLLAQSSALVFPILWPEPFGLVVIEALVSGTPVLASPLGSLPELVTPDVGALISSKDDWVEILKRKELPWSPEACRERVLKHFHYRKMAETYEAVYKRVLLGEILNPEAPVAGDWRHQ